MYRWRESQASNCSHLCHGGMGLFTTLFFCLHCSEGGGSGTVSEHIEELSQHPSSMKVGTPTVNLLRGYILGS